MEFMSALQNGFDEQKPSLFELLSEQQLSALIPPSLRYLLTVATHRHPRYLLRVLNSFDELYALLMLAVERHYLLTYGGGFTENFYGLKREKAVAIKGGEAPRARLGAPALLRESLQLRQRDVWNNLAIMVGIPYLKRKLDESYDIHVPQVSLFGPNYNQDALPHNATIKQRILYYYKWFLRKIYPSINAAYYFSILAFSLSYLFDNSKFSSPFLWLVGTRMRRLNQADYRVIALAEQPPTPSPTNPRARPGQGSSIFSPSNFATLVYPRLLSSLKLLLPTSIFALKFLEWWHASDFARQLSKKATEGLDLPPPIVSGLPPSMARSDKSKLSQSASPSRKFTNTVSLSSSTVHVQRKETSERTKRTPPISSISLLPIHTVPAPTMTTTSLCPICMHPIQTPTSAQTGFVYCYTCIFKWVDGSHERQVVFMTRSGSGGEEGWDDEDFGEDEDEVSGNEVSQEVSRKEGKGRASREGKWESGKGRCAVTGRRVLGGTDGLRRVMV